MVINFKCIKTQNCKLLEPYSKPEIVLKLHNDIVKYLLHAKLSKSVFSE